MGINSSKAMKQPYLQEAPDYPLLPRPSALIKSGIEYVDLHIWVKDDCV